MMGVALFSSRIVINALGEVDYGIYGIVGGIVAIFAVLKGALSDATQRFLNIALGRDDEIQIARTYNMSLIIYVLIALLVVFLAETVGLWFLNNYLNIPPDRMQAAKIVYHFSVAASAIAILSVPLDAVIVAYEKMSFYAYMSILEALLKLGVAFIICLDGFDKLKFYAMLMCALFLVVALFKFFYCRSKFKATRFKLVKDKTLFTSLMNFSAWTFFGKISYLANSHGINILFNIFNGVKVNAAMGIANIVNVAFYDFVNNFQIAFKPQLIKRYAENNMPAFISLIFKTSKFSFYLSFFIFLPFFLNTEFVLNVWLKNMVPEYGVGFARLLVAYSLIGGVSAPIWLSVQATGKIKTYQLIASFLFFLNLPIAFIMLYLGFNPLYVMGARILVNIAASIWRVFYVQKLYGFPALEYIRKIWGMMFAVAIVASLIPSLSLLFIPEGWSRFLVSGTLSVLCVSATVMTMGVTSGERSFIINMLKEKFVFLKKFQNNI